MTTMTLQIYYRIMGFARECPEVDGKTNLVGVDQVVAGQRGEHLLDGWQGNAFVFGGKPLDIFEQENIFL